jgi:hypothetical protein
MRERAIFRGSWWGLVRKRVVVAAPAELLLLSSIPVGASSSREIPVVESADLPRKCQRLLTRDVPELRDHPSSHKTGCAQVELMRSSRVGFRRRDL